MAIFFIESATRSERPRLCWGSGCVSVGYTFNARKCRILVQHGDELSTVLLSINALPTVLCVCS